MTVSHWLAWLFQKIARLFFGLWLMSFSGVIAAQEISALPALQTLVQAKVTTLVNGQSQHASVELPYHWDKHHKGQQGEAIFQLGFDLAVPLRNESMALLIPKLGNAYTIELNGLSLQQQGDMTRYNGADYSQLPRYIILPPEWLRTHNLLQVHIRADIGRRGGLAPVIVGPSEAVHEKYEQYHNGMVVSSGAVSMFSLVIGVIALSLWATQVDRSLPGRVVRDPLYLYAGLAEGVWSVGVGYVFLERPPVPWPWWGLLSIFALGTWCCSMALFCVEVVGWGQRPQAMQFRRGLLGLLMLCPAMAYMAVGQGYAWMLTAWYVAMGLAFLGFAMVFSWYTWRHSTPWSHRVAALVIWFNLAMGMRDIYVFRIDPQYPQITWVRFSSVLFGITLLYIVVTRFRRASEQAHVLLETMASRVAKREDELRESYEQLEKMAREQERGAERSRILRDMHDGVGAHISSAIRQVEAGQTSSAELLATLRDSLDQLKLSIDVMNLPGGDVNGLLANLRYRLGPRFAASGIQLAWRVDLLPELSRLDTQAIRHLQFILFEAFSNILQHAKCRVMVVSAQADAQSIQITIFDNGIGFDVTQPSSSGRYWMQERATAIRADLIWSSVPGATQLRIRLPF